jgi:cytochrome c peroxidase
MTTQFREFFKHALKLTLSMERWFFIVLIPIFLLSCKKDSPLNNGDLTQFQHNPRPYEIEQPEFFSPMEIPSDNPLTIEGVRLGRFLFYDPILSADSSLSCASCHLPELAFADGQKTSQGVTGEFGSRSSMSLINVGYFNNGFFWDGRAQTLEDQALHPIEDPLEMNETWANVEEKLRRNPIYPKMFRQAFPIKNEIEITRDLAIKAIAQFERTLISANSKYDQAVSFDNPTVEYSQLELDGYLLYFRDIQTNHPGCHHCHAPPLFGGDTYLNNGLDEVQDLNDFNDLGYGAVTGSQFDNGKFKTPSLRNIELSAPYMHDGRFETLEEVLEHYSSGGHYADNLDPNITGFTMTQYEKEALLAFLKSLTDDRFFEQSEIKNPF